MPQRFIGSGDDDGTIVFRLVYSKDRNLVGLIEESSPNIIYALHDFASGGTWSGSDIFSARGPKWG